MRQTVADYNTNRIDIQGKADWLPDELDRWYKVTINLFTQTREQADHSREGPELPPVAKDDEHERIRFRI
jgi:hypothetical protein